MMYNAYLIGIEYLLSYVQVLIYVSQFQLKLLAVVDSW